MDKEDLKNDIVGSGLGSITSYTIKNKNQFLAVIVLASIAIATYVSYKNNAKNKQEALMGNTIVQLLEANKSIDGIPASLEIEFKNIIDEAKGSSAEELALVYLANHYYKESSFSQLEGLISEHSRTFKDPFMQASRNETQSNLAINNEDPKAVGFLNNLPASKDIEVISSRLNISKAFAYISVNEYDNAIKVLESIDKDNASADKTKIEELISYCNAKK